jgi:hypothetical protein
MPEQANAEEAWIKALLEGWADDAAGTERAARDAEAVALRACDAPRVDLQQEIVRAGIAATGRWTPQCGLNTPWRQTMAYAGPCSSGWAHSVGVVQLEE